MKKILLFLLLIGLLIVPGMALNITWDRSYYFDPPLRHTTFDNIQSIRLNTVSNTTNEVLIFDDLTTHADNSVNFTYWYNDGSYTTGSIVTVSNYWTFIPTGMNFTMNMGDMSRTGTASTLNAPGTLTFTFYTLAWDLDTSDQYAVLFPGVTGGLTEGIIFNDHKNVVYQRIGGNSSYLVNPIIALEITSEDPIDVNVWTYDYSNLVNARQQHLDLVSYAGLLYESGAQIIAFGMMVFNGFMYFFIGGRFMLLILIIEGGIFAYRINTSKDVFRASEKIMSDNKRFFSILWDFFLALCNTIANIITALLSWIP